MRGQVSLFIIIGIVIAILASIFIIKAKFEPIDHEDNTKVTKYVQACMNGMVFDAMEKIGREGMINPTTYLASSDAKVAYLFFKGRIYQPSLENYEQQIANYLSENMMGCSEDLPDDIGRPMVKVSIKDTIEATATYPDFEVTDEIKINFKEFYDQSSKIVKNAAEDPNWIYLDELTGNGFDVKLIKVDKFTIIYVLKKEDFEYRFAVKY
ncbi:MAG: hypothetical protein NDI94_03110 [Candidatus Woesearchaeota archaeon]|nr:hypothetical protein [Candidatus Woesearchaeota archaeon]